MHVRNCLVGIAVDDLPSISHDDPTRPLNVDRQPRVTHGAISVEVLVNVSRSTSVVPSAVIVASYSMWTSVLTTFPSRSLKIRKSPRSTWEK